MIMITVYNYSNETDSFKLKFLFLNAWKPWLILSWICKFIVSSFSIDLGYVLFLVFACFLGGGGGGGGVQSGVLD